MGACAVAAVLAIWGLRVWARGHVYRGPTAEPRNWLPGADRGRVVAEARKLIGVLYDPLQGYFGDPFGRSGLIVCMDVPVIAYRNAGASLRRLLEADFEAHPDRYRSNGGKPGDPFFHRRARNLHAFCAGSGRLDLGGPPRPGDVAFYSGRRQGMVTHIALVSAVRPDGSYDVVEASRDHFYLTREAPGEEILRRGFVFRGFGDVLGYGAAGNLSPPAVSHPP